MPDWVETACRTYQQRIGQNCRLTVDSIAAGRRGKKADINRILEDEGARLLARIPDDAWVIALERNGRELDSNSWARVLEQRMQIGQALVFLIGGPEGLAPSCLARADEVWSMSRLTLAHPVARVVLLEQLYRVWSIINHKPYHR